MRLLLGDEDSFDVLNMNTYTTIAYVIFISCVVAFACLFSICGRHLHKMYISSPTTAPFINQASESTTKHRTKRSKRLHYRVSDVAHMRRNLPPGSSTPDSTHSRNHNLDIGNIDIGAEQTDEPISQKVRIKLTPWPSEPSKSAVMSNTATTSSNRVSMHGPRLSGFSLTRLSGLVPALTPALSTPASEFVSNAHMTVDMENAMTPDIDEHHLSYKHASYENIVENMQIIQENNNANPNETAL